MICAYALELVPAIVLATLAVGCGSAVEEDAESGGGAVSAEVDKHRSQVASCNRGDDDTKAFDCLVKANDAVLDQLGRNLSEADKGDRLRAKSALLSYRGASELLCQHSADLAAKGGEEAARTSCLRDRETTAATLVDAFASLGGELQSLEEPRKNHALCFEKYDRADTSNQQTIYAATVQLGNCVEGDARFVRDDLADPTIANHPSLKRDDVLAALDRNFDRAVESNATFCSMLADAGENGGELGKLDVADCRIHAGAALYAWAVEARSITKR